MAETLLYVDDSLSRLEVMQIRLRQLGYEVLTAANGVDALKLFTEKYVDVAVVDYYMPGMSGDLVAMEMKSIRPAIPVIIFSGTFTLSEMVVAFVDGFVSTSDEPDALVNKISEILKPRRSARAS
ncbi:MAG TPA: response regulator [Terriglobales bacterium]|nr:response regulator [Terriglobales bacterium]